MNEQDTAAGGKHSTSKQREIGLGLEDFEVRFKKAFHREMTSEEKKFFQLAEQILGMDEEPEKQTASAVPTRSTTDC